MAAREKPSCCPVGCHGLVRFILRCERVPECYPGGCKVLIQAVCLVEISPCQIILLNQAIIGALYYFKIKAEPNEHI